MTSVFWNKNTSGAWATASNWTPGKVPTATDDVTIFTSTTLTVTFAGITDTIFTLNAQFGDFLQQTSGTLKVLSSATLGTFTQTGGTLQVNAGTIEDLLTQNAGQITVTSDFLQLQGKGNLLNGTINGAGLLDIVGNTTLGANAVLSVAALGLGDLSTLSIEKTLSFAGQWVQTSGTVLLGTNTLALTGPADLETSAIAGNGTLSLSGQTVFNSLDVLGSLTIVNTGTVHQTGSLILGIGSLDTPTLVNRAGAVYTIDGGSAFNSTTGAHFTNAGTVRVEGSGVTTIPANFISTGTVDVSAGELQLSQNATLEGVVTGSGELDLQFGSDLLGGNLTLSIGEIVIDTSSQVTLGGNLTYGGIFVQAAGVLTLGGKTLNLTGAVDLNGGAIAGIGAIALSGATELQNWSLGGLTSLSNTGTVNEVSDWYLGSSPGDAPVVTNKNVWRMSGDSTIRSGSGAEFVNEGEFVKAGPTKSEIDANFINAATATLTVGTGSLFLAGNQNSLAGTINGAGNLVLSNGTDTLQKGLALQVATVQVGMGATVDITASIAPTGIWEQQGGAVSVSAGKVLTLAHGSDFSGTVDSLGGIVGGTVGGAGLLIAGGSNTFSQLFLGNTVFVRNNKYVYQTGDVHIGYNTGDAPVVFNLALSTWRMFDNANIYGTTGAQFRNAGTLAFSGAGTGVINVTMANAGAIVADFGLLRFLGSGSTFAGSLNGAGTIDFYNGSDVFESGLKINVSNLYIESSAIVTFTGNITDTHAWNQLGGTLALGGFTATLRGSANLSGGAVIGSGLMALSGSTTLGGIYFGGSTTITNTGTVSQIGSWYLGSNLGDTAQGSNAAGALWRIENGSTIYGGNGSSFTNAGTIVSSGSAAEEVLGDFASSGVLTINDGLLEFAGANNALGGIIDGNGTIDMYQGAYALSAGLSIDTAHWLIDGYATVGFGGNVAYGGDFALLSGTLALGGHTLTLSGRVDLGGADFGGIGSDGGTIALTSNGEVGNFTMSGAALTNAGTLTDTGTLSLFSNNGDTSTFTNLAGATLNIENRGGINGSTDATFINAGTVVDSGLPTSFIEVPIINTGNVLVGSNSMKFDGGVSGMGTFEVGAGGGLEFGGAVASGAHIVLDVNSHLKLDYETGFAGTVSTFTTGDEILLPNVSFSGTTVSFNAATDRLTLTYGKQNATIQFAGNHIASDFRAIDELGLLAIFHS